MKILKEEKEKSVGPEQPESNEIKWPCSDKLTRQLHASEVDKSQKEQADMSMKTQISHHIQFLICL